jgi:hypothetical protein
MHSLIQPRFQPSGIVVQLYCTGYAAVIKPQIRCLRLYERCISFYRLHVNRKLKKNDFFYGKGKFTYLHYCKL